MIDITASNRRRWPLLGALVALLLAVCLAMLLGIRSFGESSRWVSHTHQVISQIQAVRGAIDTTEATARGYRLSGDPGLESEYEASRVAPVAQASALVQLVEDNPAQQRRAEVLRTRVARRLASIEDSVADYRAGRADAANRRMLAIGVAQHHDIGRAADALLANERALLARREVERTRDASALTAIVITGTLVSLGMLGLLLQMVGRQARRALRLEREARDALATLEASTAQREHLAEQRRLLGAFAGLLHSCQSMEEALSIAGNALHQLVPHGAGVFYGMRASQNVLERQALFGTHGLEYPEVMQPGQCWALRRGSLHPYDPQQPTVLCEHLRDLPDDQACGACMPLASQGATLGLLHVSARDASLLTELERAAVESVGEHLAVVLHSLQLRESLRVQSLRDPLTGLYNRRYLEESLPREIDRCERRGRPLSVLMLDVDHFKRFNDEHGHGAGDALLARIGEVLATLTRGEDIACRYGGEEFTVVMPEAGLEQACQRANQIREAIAAASVSYMRRELGPVTASIGVHELRPRLDTPASLMATADRALYAAKAQGRDRVVAATPDRADAALSPPVDA